MSPYTRRYLTFTYLFFLIEELQVIEWYYKSLNQLRGCFPTLFVGVMQINRLLELRIEEAFVLLSVEDTLGPTSSAAWKQGSEKQCPWEPQKAQKPKHTLKGASGISLAAAPKNPQGATDEV